MPKFNLPCDRWEWRELGNKILAVIAAASLIGWLISKAWEWLFN
ncbi:hypothetical protein [Nibribacter ruber]|nr:hypothetical protein [Nibribacter ruber]